MATHTRVNSLRKKTATKSRKTNRPVRATVASTGANKPVRATVSVRKSVRPAQKSTALAGEATALKQINRQADELSDKELAAMVAKGDQVAWRRVYEKWQVELTRYGSSQGWDRELVQDLVQDTLIRAWSKRTSYNSKYPYRVWILTIFRRLAMTHYRRVKTHGKTVDQQPSKSTDMPWWAENQTDMSGAIETNDIRAILEPLLKGLRPEDQKLLHEWSLGVCQATLAKEMGANPVTLRTQILRAKARLVKAFQERYPELAEAGWASQGD